jgi:hypothetical protein
VLQAPRAAGFDIALALMFRGFLERALFQPRKALHAVVRDLFEDRIDPGLLVTFLLDTLLCALRSAARTEARALRLV